MKKIKVHKSEYQKECTKYFIAKFDFDGYRNEFVEGVVESIQGGDESVEIGKRHQ